MILIRRRLVRIHQIDPGPTTEGILVGKPWRNAGFFVLRNASIIAAPDQTMALDGDKSLIPREKVTLVQQLR
jgi:hypothetical protein